MRILFTRNNKSIFSRAIQWATDWDISHVSLEEGELVFHSNLLGPGIVSLEDFLKKSEVVRVVEIDTKTADLLRLVKFFVKRQRRSYDFLLFISLGLSLLMRKLLNTKISPSLLNRVSGAYLCTEFVSEFITGKEDVSLILPRDLFNYVQSKS